MLTLQLLRVRTRNGAIFPLFCTKDEEIELAKKIILEFEHAWKNKENKERLKRESAGIRRIRRRWGRLQTCKGILCPSGKEMSRSKVEIAIVTMMAEPSRSATGSRPAPSLLSIHLALGRRYLKNHQKGVLH